MREKELKGKDRGGKNMLKRKEKQRRHRERNKYTVKDKKGPIVSLLYTD